MTLRAVATAGFIVWCMQSNLSTIRSVVHATRVLKHAACVSFGKVIRQRRRAVGWTLEDLAERASLTPNYVGALERDPRRDPSLSTVVSLARAFKVAPGELLGGIKGLGAEAVEAARLYEGCPPEIQDAVLRLLRASARRRR